MGHLIEWFWRFVQNQIGYRLFLQVSTESGNSPFHLDNNLTIKHVFIISLLREVRAIVHYWCSEAYFEIKVSFYVLHLYSESEISGEKC